MTARSTQSRKAKGRRLQQFIRDKIITFLCLPPNDVRSTSMGAGGSDILLSDKAIRLFPYAIECKNTEKLALWQAWEQAVKHAESTRLSPLLFVKRNGQKPLAIVDAEEFIKLHGVKKNGKETS